MSNKHLHPVTNCRPDYATRNDFCKALADDIPTLYLLAFMLTTNHRVAELCFLCTVDQTLESKTVFRGWVRRWIRRTLITIAISKVFNVSKRREESDSWFEGNNEIASAINAVTQLDDVDRFVFVMMFLERYSARECALLLGVSGAKIPESLERSMRNMLLALR